MIRGLVLWVAGAVLGVLATLMVHEAKGVAPVSRYQGAAIPDVASPAVLYPMPDVVAIPSLVGLFPERPRPLWADMLPASASGNPFPWAADRECMARWDRFDWEQYAKGYDWLLADAAYVAYAETGGTFDLCSVNRSSGATCWFQLLSGTDEGIQRGYLDPRACVEGAYRKWVDGGGDFTRHWFAHWTVAAAKTEDGNGSSN